MARTYAPIHCTIWSDPAFLSLSSQAQRLYILALSQPTISLCGVVAYTPKRWVGLSSDTTPRIITKAVAELVQKGFILVDEDTEELMIRSFVKYDGTEKKPNLIKGMWTAWLAVHSQRLKERFIEGLPERFYEHFPEGFDRSPLNPSEWQSPTTSSITTTRSSSSSAKSDDDGIASLIEETLVLLAKRDLQEAQRKGVRVIVPQRWLQAAKQTRIETGDRAELIAMAVEKPHLSPADLADWLLAGPRTQKELCGRCINGVIINEDDSEQLEAVQCDCQKVSA